MKWKPLRAVVEIKVPPSSSLKQRDLHYAVKYTLEDAYSIFERGLRGNTFTKPRVKRYSNVQAHRRTKQHG